MSHDKAVWSAKTSLKLSSLQKGRLGNPRRKNARHLHSPEQTHVKTDGSLFEVFLLLQLVCGALEE